MPVATTTTNTTNMPFKCDLCNLALSNEAQFKQHLEGKKHKKLESVKEEREKSALKSVFVSGLKRTIFIKHLEEHFEQFGKVNKVIIDKDKNAYAIIEFHDEESVEKTLKHPEHIINEKHVKVRHRVNKEFIPKIVNKVDKKKELLEKMKKEAIALNVILSNCESFDDQINKLVEFLKIDDSELHQRKSICDHLNELYAKFFPNSHVTTFGSTLTGLACKGSDMDLTLLMNEYLKLNENKQQKPPKLKEKSNLKQQNSSDSSGNSENNMENDELAFDIDENTCESLKEQNNNEYFTESVLDQKCKEILNLELDEAILISTKILQRHASGLQDMRNVSNARCPVVRFFHDKTKINCELS